MEIPKHTHTIHARDSFLHQPNWATIDRKRKHSTPGGDTADSCRPIKKRKKHPKTQAEKAVQCPQCENEIKSKESLNEYKKHAWIKELPCSCCSITSVWYQSQWAPNITFFVNANYAIAEDKLVIRSAKPDPVERDRITLLVLNREAQLETPEYFHTVTPTEPAKILWDSTGHAGYLYSNYFGFPEALNKTKNILFSPHYSSSTSF